MSEFTIYCGITFVHTKPNFIMTGSAKNYVLTSIVMITLICRIVARDNFVISFPTYNQIGKRTAYGRIISLPSIKSVNTYSTGNVIVSGTTV